MPETTDTRAKVLFVLPNFGGGGAERVALTLLNHLDRENFSPELMVLDDRGPLRSLPAADTRLHVLGRPHLRWALPQLIALIRRRRPAVIFATQGYINMALLAARPFMLAGTRIALRESNTPSQSLPNRRHPRVMAWAYRHFYPRADLLCCQHRQTEREMHEDFGVAPARIAELPNPVSVAQLRGLAAQPLRHPGTGLRFVAAGRLNRQKGFDRLVKLFAELPESSHLTVYGEGKEREALLQEIESLNLARRVVLAGYSDQLPAALAGADACVISSRWEGLPNVALEALAVGTPVIATPESGGIAELAQAAAPGAVTVADWGEAFGAAMTTCRQRSLKTPAPSLLPERYALENVMATFNNLLRKLAGRADVLHEGQS